METYYIKKGKKYIPVGYQGPDLHAGVWLVQINPGSRNMKNLSFYLDELPDPADLQVLTKTVMLEDIILKTMQECWKDADTRCSFATCASKIALALTNAEVKIKKLTTKEFRRADRVV